MPPGGQTRGQVDGSEVVTVVVVHDVIFGRHRSIILPPEFFGGCEDLYRIEVGKLIEFVHFKPKNLRVDRPNWAMTIKTRSSNIRRKRNQRRNLSPHCCHEWTTENPFEIHHQWIHCRTHWSTHSDEIWWYWIAIHHQRSSAKCHRPGQSCYRGETLWTHRS